MLNKIINKIAVHRRLTISLLTLIIIALTFLAYLSGKALEESLMKEKERDLFGVAQYLEGSLEGSFREILIRKGALDKPLGIQVKVLKEELQPILDEVSKLQPNFGMGYHSLELNQIVAIEPYEEGVLDNFPENSAHLKVYESGKVELTYISESIGFKGEPVFKLSYPIYREGELIGHSWSSVKTDDITSAVAKHRNLIFFATVILIVLVTLLVFFLTKLQKEALEKIASKITKGEDMTENNLFPELQGVFEKIHTTTNNLRQERNLQQLVLNGLPVGIVMFDKNQKLSFANKAFEQFSGNPLVKIIGIKAQELLHLSYYEEEWSNNVVEKVLASKEAKEGYIRNIKGENGEKIVARVSTYPLIDPKGGVRGTVSIFQDITDTERLRLLLKQEEVVFGKLNYGIIVFDKNFQCISFNREAQNLFKLSKESVLGRSFSEVIAALPKELGSLQEIVREKNIINNTEVEITIGGRSLTILLNFDILKDDTDKLLGYVLIAKDISELKLQTKIIAEQEKLASIGQMAAGMAHEMRNPLTAIKGFVHLLAERPLCKEEATVYQYLQIVKEEIDRLNSIIGDFLLFARPAKPNLEKVAVNDLLSETIFLVESQCMMQGVAIKQRLSAIELNSLGDKNQIKQVILNLFSNAIDALKSSLTKEINVKTELVRLEAKKESYICISLQDTGSGISAEAMEKLFTPFFTTKDHGTGLGLSGSLRIIENHGGTIKVESIQGQGAKFMIYLPQIR